MCSVCNAVFGLQEVERNLQDAMQVCRNVLLDPFLLPGGGAVEMAVSKRLMERSRSLTGIEQWPYRAVAQALEVIPRTLIQNCGASTIRVLTSLRVTQDFCLAVNPSISTSGVCALLVASMCRRVQLKCNSSVCVCSNSGQTHSGQQRVLGCRWGDWLPV